MLNLVKRISILLVYTNGVVSLATASMTFGICRQLGIDNAILYAVFVFFSTLFTYNLQRYIKSFHYSSASTLHMQWVLRNRKHLLYLLILAFVGIGVSFLAIYNGITIKSWGILMLSGIISFFYIQKVKKTNLRSIPFIKIHLIALIWMIAVCVFPAINEGLSFSEYYHYAILTYAYIIGITIPFDIRDLKYDDRSFRTIPQLVGVKNAKSISIGLLFTFFYFTIQLSPGLLYHNLFYLGFILTILLVVFVNQTRNDLYYSGWLESSIILVGLGMV